MGGLIRVFWDEQEEASRVESCTNALVAIKFRIENNRWTEFFGWRACPPRRRPTKNGRHPTRMTPENAGLSQPKKMGSTHVRHSVSLRGKAARLQYRNKCLNDMR